MWWQGRENEDDGMVCEGKMADEGSKRWSGIREPTLSPYLPEGHIDRAVAVKSAKTRVGILPIVWIYIIP